jgi:glucosamine 6-phosphate synthetase-like amidotransferase/phosphosugar isomerase protein
MCGVGAIAWINSDKKPATEINQKMMQMLIAENMIETLPRGRDATGFAVLHEDTSCTYLKAGWESPKLIQKVDGEKYPDNWEAFIDRWDGMGVPASLVLGHVRKATSGNVWDNENNHPIHRGNIIGIHNGNVSNHKEIFEDLKGKVEDRKGDVDSEAIFALMESMHNDTPFTQESVTELCNKLEGAFTVLAFNRLFPNQLLIFRNAERPAAFGIDFDLNMIMIGSEQKYIDPVIVRYNRFVTLYGNKGFPSLNIKSSTIQAKKACILDLNELPEEDSTLFSYLDGKCFDVELKCKSYGYTYTNGTSSTATSTTTSSYQTGKITQNAYAQSSSLTKATTQTTGALVVGSNTKNDAAAKVGGCSSTELETDNIKDKGVYEIITKSTTDTSASNATACLANVHSKSKFEKNTDEKDNNDDDENEYVDIDNIATLEKEGKNKGLELASSDWERHLSEKAEASVNSWDDQELINIVEEAISEEFENQAEELHMSGDLNETFLVTDEIVQRNINKDMVSTIAYDVALRGYKAGFRGGFTEGFEDGFEKEMTHSSIVAALEDKIKKLEEKNDETLKLGVTASCENPEKDKEIENLKALFLTMFKMSHDFENKKQTDKILDLIVEEAGLGSQKKAIKKSLKDDIREEIKRSVKKEMAVG